ncbi:uncharacterized protein LOC132044180 [Lycium ferocissimum]|uniref:uncharacterized protein LOC132044180 n=1 Tax=Lycium ferocissimum TaxID=112874 RepID=UPI002816735B|nr:uncharacterized protein LOC132044180 [Lycium ferocissimum]
MDKSFVNITRLLDKLTTHNQAWHSNDSEILSYGSPSVAVVTKENYERDHAFAQLKTTVDLLSKRLAEKEAKSVNVVEEMPSHSPRMYQVSEETYLEGQPQREDTNYIDNSQGGYQKQWRPQQQSNQYGRNKYGGSDMRDYNNNNYGNRNSNAYVPAKGCSSNSQNWREGPSNDQGTSRMESMLEEILDNENKSDKKTKNLTEVVGSHTASIQKLESQIRDLSREQHPPQRGAFLATQLRTQEVIEEEIKEELETPIEVPIIVEKEKEAHPIVLEGDEVTSIEKVTEDSTQKSKVTGVIKPLTQTYKSPPPFPQRLMKRTEDAKCQRFYDQLKGLSMNIPFHDAFQEMPGFAKYLKDLLTKKRPIKHDTVGVTHHVSAIISSSKVEKKGDPGAFTIPCTIDHHDFAPIYKQSGLGTPRPTSMRLQMADRTIKRPVGVVDDVLVRVGGFLLPVNFVILDCAVDKEVPIILGRTFLATGRALMDSKKNEIKFRVNDEEVTFQASRGLKLPSTYESSSVINSFDVVDEVVEHKLEEKHFDETLSAILVNFEADDMEGYIETVNSLIGRGSYSCEPKKLSLDLDKRITPPAKPSIIEPPKLELKLLPSHLKFAFLGPDNTLPIILSSLLNEK